jgi:hypothetical protein
MTELDKQVAFAHRCYIAGIVVGALLGSLALL